MLEDLEDLNSPEEVRLRHSHISHVLSQRAQPVLQLAFDPPLSSQAAALPRRLEALLKLHICTERRNCKTYRAGMGIKGDFAFPFRQHLSQHGI